MQLKEQIKKYIKDPHTKELVLKSSSFFFIKSFGALAGYLFTLFVARIYGAEVNGLLTISFSVFLIGAILPRLGFDINLVKTFSSKSLGEAKHAYKKTISLSLLIALILSGIGYFFKGFIAEKFNIESTNYILFGLISIPLWTAVLINTAVLRGMKRIVETSFLKNAGRFLFALILFGLCYYVLGFKNQFVPGVVHTIGLFCLSTYSFVLVFKRLAKYKSIGSNFELKAYVKSSLPMLFSASLILFLSWTDTVFLGIFNPTEDVGIYNISLKIATLVGFSLQSLDSILAPKIAKAHSQDDKPTFEKLIKMAVRINFFFALFASLGLILFRNYILGFFGDEFLAGSGVLVILCVGQFVNALCGPTGVVFEMTGNQKIFRNLVFLAFIVNFGLDLVLIQPFGFYGAAISSIVSLSLWNLIGAIIAWRKFKVRIFYWPQFKPTRR